MITGWSYRAQRNGQIGYQFLQVGTALLSNIPLSYHENELDLNSNIRLIRIKEETPNV